MIWVADRLMNAATLVVYFVLDVLVTWAIFAFAVLSYMLFVLAVADYSPDLGAHMTMLVVVGLPLAVIIVTVPHQRYERTIYIRPFTLFMAMRGLHLR